MSQTYLNDSYYLQTSPSINNGQLDTVYLGVQKVTSNGNCQYAKKYLIPNRNGFAYPHSITVNNKNDILIFGLSTNSIITLGQGGGDKYSILRIDSNGNEIKKKVFYAQTVQTIDYASNMVKYGNENYLIYGSGGSSGYGKPYLVKINDNLDTIQTKTTYFSTSTARFTPEYGKAIYSKSNHFYVSGSYSTSSNYVGGQAIIQKLDTSLNILWTVTLPQTNNGPNHLYELENDTILCVAMDQANGKFWFHKLLPDGTLAVPSTFVASGLGGFSFAFRSVLKRNGQLAVCGESNKKAYMAVIQLNSRPAVVTITKESFVEALAKSSILFYPNPA
ncbi:MAG: hypothetical protein K2Q22_12840, partial [Cytophagales bacterium]|nr:hypothetical protein [Cytophagales bacterium]